MGRSTGTYQITSVGGENVQAFIPHPLPPERPRIRIVGDLASLLQSAETGLARLEAAGRMVPSLDWFVYAFVRKEAVISSQIEGTQASLDDLLATEAEAPITAPPEHVEEICNYLEAVQYARGQLHRDKGLPLSVRLFNGTHKRLMTGARGQNKRPGKIRRFQNWIGGTRPGLVHAQFETIHPYLDGNGRLGRLLIALCLEEWGLLSEPLLYLSLFFKRHRDEYYTRLGAIRTEGDWEGWLGYFLEGVAVVSEESVGLIRSLFDVLTRDRSHYLESGSVTVVGARLFENLPRNPLVTVKSVVKTCQTTYPTAAKAIDSLCQAGILEETSGRSRDRVYAYREYLNLLRKGTEL